MPQMRPALCAALAVLACHGKRAMAEVSLSGPKSTNEWLQELGENKALKCSGCEFVCRHLQKEVGPGLKDELRKCRGDPACLKDTLAKIMRARCKRIGSVADVGPIVLIDKVRYAHHSETLAGDKPKNVEFLVDNNAMLSNLCSSLVGDGKWLAQAMADYTMKKIPLVAFNMSRAGCEDELRVCKYPEEVGLAEAVSAAIEKRSDEVLAAEKTAAEQQEDDAKAEWKQFTEAVNKWRAEKASKASTKEGEAKAEL